jgi:hypothetical protein
MYRSKSYCFVAVSVKPRAIAGKQLSQRLLHFGVTMKQIDVRLLSRSLIMLSSLGFTLLRLGSIHGLCLDTKQYFSLPQRSQPPS